MTEEQWEKVRDHVLKELAKKSPFKITSKRLAAEFGLKQPIFVEIRRRACEPRVFFVKTSWWDETDPNDPIDPITFTE